ncbi:MAG: hypothetical protein GX862_02990 [Leucobacter sp.]|nr:hypothetical protein [Leucobacter sp.]
MQNSLSLYVRRVLQSLAAAIIAAALLSACAAEAEPPASGGADGAAPSAAAPSDAAAGESGESGAQPGEPVVREQAETCGWELAALTAEVPELPSGQTGELQDVIIGAWQHTHFDSGSGFEQLANEDIRYVFPSTDRLLYCQHIPGITEHAENAASITLEATKIVLPGGHPGFVVTHWSDDTMLWNNPTDGSTYVLQRR